MAGLLHHHHQHHQHSGKRHDAILFFLIAVRRVAVCAGRRFAAAGCAHALCLCVQVAYKVPWTAVSSLLGQLATKFHDPRVLLHLNLGENMHELAGSG